MTSKTSCPFSLVYHLEKCLVSLRWRHNGHDSVSNHKPHYCLLNRLFGCRSKETSKARVTGDMGRNTFLYKTHSTKQLVMKNKFKWNIRSKFWKWNVYNDSCQNGVSTCATCYWGRMCEVQREDLPREQHHKSSGMESVPPGWHRHWPQLCGSKISARTNPVSRHRSRRRHFRGWRRCGRSRRGSSGHWPCWREACGSGTSVV